jgi:hypothetical protein
MRLRLFARLLTLGVLLLGPLGCHHCHKHCRSCCTPCCESCCGCSCCDCGYHAAPPLPHEPPHAPILSPMPMPGGQR